MRVTHLPLLSQIFTPQKCVRWIVFLGCNDVFRCLLLGTGSRATIIIMYWLGLYMCHCFQCKTCHCNVSWNLSIYMLYIIYIYCCLLCYPVLVVFFPGNMPYGVSAYPYARVGVENEAKVQIAIFSVLFIHEREVTTQKLKFMVIASRQSIYFCAMVCTFVCNKPIYNWSQFAVGTVIVR